MCDRQSVARVIVTIVATAGITFISGPIPAGAAPMGASLRVNDLNAVGKVGDGLLSLNEAVRLANGSLGLATLSVSERIQVTGTPGAENPDVVTLPTNQNLTLGLGQGLVKVRGNEGDTIDGNGSTLIPSAVGIGNGLTIASSDFTLREFGVEKFLVNIRVETGGQALRNINLRDVRTSDGTIGELQVGAGSSNGSLSGLAITNSTFAAQGSAIGVLIFAAQPTAGVVNNVRLEHVLFEGNTVSGGGQGLSFGGGYGLASSMSNASASDFRVINNRFVGQADAPLNIDGGIAAVASTGKALGVDGVVVEHNEVEAANYGIWVGNEAIGLGLTPSRLVDAYIRNVRIAHNVVVGTNPGRRWCLTVENAADFALDYNANSTVDGVQIVDNDITNCSSTVKDEIGYGISIIPGRASVFTDVLGALYLPGPSTIQKSSIRDVLIQNNRVVDAEYGLRLIGGNSTHPSVSYANSLTGVQVIGNQFSLVPTGIQIFGGQGPLLSAMTKNSVTDVSFLGNTIAGSSVPCKVSNNSGPGAFGNLVSATCPQ